MTHVIQSVRKLFTKKMILAIAAGATLMPVFASAADRDRGYDRGDRYDYRRDHDDRRDDHRDSKIDVNIRIGNSPRYEDRTERVWVEPIYRTVCDRVWRPAVMQDVCDRVWVESLYEDRDVVHYEHGRRIIVRERVLLSPGHFEERHHQVLISDGHWENIERQELVSAGHFEYRATRERVADSGSWGFGFFNSLPR